MLMARARERERRLRGPALVRRRTVFHPPIADRQGECHGEECIVRVTDPRA